MWDSFKNWFTGQSNAFLNVALKAVIILVVGMIVIRVVTAIVNRALKRSKLEKAAYSLINTLVKTVLSVLLLLCLAGSLGIDVTGIVALASVVTLAVSLALQNMLTNVVGGFTLLYTHPFKSGDFVEIAGQSGTIQEIGIAYTKLSTPDNKIVFIPNSAVVAAEIINYSTTGVRRVDINISASYDAPVQLVLDTLLEMAQRPEILEEPAKPVAVLSSYGDSAINYTLRYWVKSSDYWPTVFDINKNMKAAFDAKGIEMTYPHLNVHIEK